MFYIVKGNCFFIENEEWNKPQIGDIIYETPKYFINIRTGKNFIPTESYYEYPEYYRYRIKSVKSTKLLRFIMGIRD